MAWQAKRWSFTRSLLQDAPEHAGVYALWEKEKLVHLGAASGSKTIRDRLLEHYEKASAEERITHYSWQITG